MKIIKIKEVFKSDKVKCIFSIKTLTFGIILFVLTTFLSYGEDIAWEITPRGTRKGMVVEVINPSGGGGGTIILSEGLATETTLSNIYNKLSDRTVYDTQLEQFKFDGNDLKVKFSNTSLDVNLTNDSIKVEGGNTNAVKVDGSAVTQPISGTISVDNFPETQIVTGDVNATLTDNTVYDTQLEQFKFTGDDLKVKFSNTSIDVGTITTLPAITGTVTANPTTYSYSPHFADTTLDDTSVWYAYTIPTGTVELSIKARTGYDFKVSDESGHTNYETIWAGDRFEIKQVRDTAITGTLYFNSPEKAGLVIEIRYLTKQ